MKHKGNEEKCECIQECPKAVKQVCASDNMTYDNECLLNKSACEKEEELTLVKHGTCAGISFSKKLVLCLNHQMHLWSKCEPKKIKTVYSLDVNGNLIHN